MLASIALSFVFTLWITPKFIIFFERCGLVGRDIQKFGKPEVAEMGGPPVLAGFLAGVFLFIWMNVFLYGDVKNLPQMLAAITTILIIMVVGMFDDMSSLQKQKQNGEMKNFKRIGIKQWQKPLLTLPAAVPLMAIMAGDTSMSLPLLGVIDVGMLYPLLLVPLGIMGASNATNMLAGMNGLEAGLGAIILSTMGAYAFINGYMPVAALALTLAAALLAFLVYNWYPAKIMPGDSLAYMIGACVAAVAIVGNMEKFAVYCFALWFIELLLKARSMGKAESFGILQSDGTLKAPYQHSYSLTHVVMRLGRFKEKEIVSILMAAQLIIGAVLLVAFTLYMNAGIYW